MKIYGYSERGAMNALFYGIALNNDEDALKAFLKLVNKDLNTDLYTDFNLFIECSLSDFGDPDLVIIAIKEKEEQDVFFVEAKVSHRNKFSLKKQREDHEEYCGSDDKAPNDKKYDASNLFFQLRLKELFFATRGKIEKDDNHDIRIKCKKLKSDDYRSKGDNEIVNIISNKIIGENLGKDYYIAVIPKCEGYEEPQLIEQFSLNIQIVTWESILGEDKLKKYLCETVKFNQTDNKSQILNAPWKDDNKIQ